MRLREDFTRTGPMLRRKHSASMPTDIRKMTRARNQSREILKESRNIAPQ